MSTPETVPPLHSQIVVIGGGPAGSYAATLLQREGHEVVLLEAAKFPRYHVGESMLPSLRNYLRFIDLENEFADHGFLPKPGAGFKLVQGIRESWTDFTALGPGYGTWNVIRSEMDDMMLRHASKQGVKVFEETRVETLDFAGDRASSRPLAAHWSNKHGAAGRITFDWLVDASGRSGIMCTKYLKNRTMRESLRNVAVWGYWKGVTRYGEGTKRACSGWFEALTDEQGWSWTIPLNDGTTSIGVVMHESASKAKKAQAKADGQKPTLTEHYLDQLQYLPGVRELIGDGGEFIPGSTKSAADYSYSASAYSGDHFRVIGDAANFVDPFFSSGVHIAMTGGLSAAITICASIRGDADENIAQRWHDAKVGIAHTRFLFVVLGAYQQMHLQSAPVLSDINAENFDDAFEMFRPVIYGLADSQTRLTDAKVQHMMDVCQSFFDPYVSEEHVLGVRARYGPASATLAGPVLGSEQIEQMVGGDTPEREMDTRVLRKFDALKVFSDDVEATYMERTVLLGYRAKVQKGELGLKKEMQENGSGNGERDARELLVATHVNITAV